MSDWTDAEDKLAHELNFRGFEMTKDDIIRMAREAGFKVGDWYVQGSTKELKSFAALVAAHEREKLAEQEQFDMDDHPPHRLCECRKCMEYFTPLPDCDAFAASGKPIAEQANTQLMEGFRPVSEMIAEHKQDPKKAAAIEKAKMRKAEQKPVAIDELARACNLAGIEYKDFLRIKAHLPIAAPVQQVEQDPVAVVEITYGREPECYVTGNIDDFPEGVFKLYTHHVRTKDLTDDEIADIVYGMNGNEPTAPFWRDLARAVIAKFKEKNK